MQQWSNSETPWITHLPILKSLGFFTQTLETSPKGLIKNSFTPGSWCEYMGGFKTQINLLNKSPWLISCASRRCCHSVFFWCATFSVTAAVGKTRISGKQCEGQWQCNSGYPFTSFTSISFSDSVLPKLCSSTVLLRRIEHGILCFCVVMSCAVFFLQFFLFPLNQEKLSLGGALSSSFPSCAASCMLWKICTLFPNCELCIEYNVITDFNLKSVQLPFKLIRDCMQCIV